MSKVRAGAFAGGKKGNKPQATVADGLTAQPREYPHTFSFAKSMPSCATRKARFGKSGFNAVPTKSGHHGNPCWSGMGS